MLAIGSTPISKFYAGDVEIARGYLGETLMFENYAPFPVIQSTSQGNSTSNGTSHAITLPSGIQAGDIILVFITNDDDDAISVNTGVSGNNWKSAGAVNASGGQLSAWWKIAEGSDALTVTIAAPEAVVWIAYRISGASQVVGGQTNTGTGTAGSLPQLNLSQTMKALWFAALGVNLNLTASEAPENYGDLIVRSVGSTVWDGLSVATRQFKSNTDTPGTFGTFASNQWYGITLAVLPQSIYSGLQLPKYTIGQVQFSNYTGWSSPLAMSDGIDNLKASVTATTAASGINFVMADFGEVTHISKIHLRPIPTSFERWGSTYLNGRTLEWSNNGTDWNNITTLSGHIDGQTKTYDVDLNCRYVRVSMDTNYVALSDFWFEG